MPTHTIAFHKHLHWMRFLSERLTPEECMVIVQQGERTDD